MKIGWSSRQDHPIHVCLATKRYFSLAVDHTCLMSLSRQTELAKANP